MKRLINLMEEFMKRILLILGMLYLFSGCEREHIMTYGNDAYIQFTGKMADSLEFSFTFYPNRDTIDYGLGVKLVGLPEDREREYKVVVVDDYTTAASGNYILPERCVLGKNEEQCELVVKLVKTPDLQTTPVRLTVRLEPTRDFMLGETSHIARIIWINDKISKPDWWNSVIVNSYLGTYSDEKYRLFIEITGVGYLNPEDAVDCRFNALLLKKHLNEKEANDETVYEKDGHTKMTVTVIGS
jgi:hypothetical protein bacD2_19332